MRDDSEAIDSTLPSDETLVSYFTGDDDPAAADALTRWIGGNPARRAKIERLRQGWGAAVRPSVDGNVEAFVTGVRARLDERGEGGGTGRSLLSPASGDGVGQWWEPRRIGFGDRALRGNPRQRNWRQHIVAFGSVILCVMLFGAMFLKSRPNRHPATHSYRTLAGQLMTVRLVNRTTLTLAPATAVTVTTQGITVIGEVYVDVAPHAGRPFLVRTRTALVRVLGTRFAVRQYANESRSRIVVEEGRVTLSPVVPRPRTRGTHTVIAAGMVAVVSDSGVMVSSDVPTRAYTSWARGTIIFDHTALRDVAMELARVYGVTIQITDTTLARQTVGLEVSLAQDSLGRVLESLCSVVGAHYTRDTHTYLISPGRSASTSRRSGPPRYTVPQPESQYGK